MGMAQVVATIAYGIRGLRTGETTWEWPDFHSDPTQENLGQIARWSLNQAPDWTHPPLAIANQYKDRHTKETKRERYRLILVRGYELEWLRKELLRKTREACAQGHNWIPKQNLPFTEIVLYAYAADCTPYPTYVLLPSGLHKARTGDIVPRHDPTQEIIPLPGMYFFDGWRVHPILKIPDNLPQTQDMPVRITARAPTEGAYLLGKHLRTRHVTSWQLQSRTKWNADPAHDAQRFVPLSIFVHWSTGMGLSSTKSTHRLGCTLSAAKEQLNMASGTIFFGRRHLPFGWSPDLRLTRGPAGNRTTTGSLSATQECRNTNWATRTPERKKHGKWYQPTGEALPVISKEVTSELLHCLTALPDPWPLAKITIDLEKPGQWVTKMARLYFSEDCAKRTDRIPNKTRGQAVDAAISEVEKILPKLVKNVNPGTPLGYSNPRIHKITTPDANTYCGCDSAVT